MWNVLSTIPYLDVSSPGCFAYSDMLTIGSPAPDHMLDPAFVENCGGKRLTDAEARAQFSAFALLSSPLVLGFDVANASERARWGPIVAHAPTLAINAAWDGEAGRLVARSAAEEARSAPDAYLLHFLTKYFTAAATAQVSKSAIEAQRMGYLKETDRIVFNGDELLYQAVREAQAMHDAGWRPPRRAVFEVMGRAGLATITAQLVNMRDGGFISGHDYHCARVIAEVVCGGDVEAGSMVDEAWVMSLERRGFTALLSHPKTQERLMSMVQTGKPVRN
jgi:hypothetical protein